MTSKDFRRQQPLRHAVRARSASSIDAQAIHQLAGQRVLRHATRVCANGEGDGRLLQALSPCSVGATLLLSSQRSPTFACRHLQQAPLRNRLFFPVAPERAEESSAIEEVFVGGTAQRLGWYRFYFDDERWEWSAEVAVIHGYESGTA